MRQTCQQSKTRLLTLPFLLAPIAARAEAPRLEGTDKIVAVRPCDGKEAAVPPRKALRPAETARAVLDLLRERPGVRYQVLGPDQWRDMARRRFRGVSTELQGIAKELRAELVVGCWLEAQDASAPRPYRLTIALYNNWAEPLGQTSFDLDNRRVEAGAFLDQAAVLLRQIDKALGLIQPEPRPAPPRRPSAVVQAEDSEPPPLPSQQPVQGPGADVPLVPPNPEAYAIYYQRPLWRPVLDVEVGYLYNLRHLTDNGSGRAFNLSGASGLRLHAELYPLAAVRSVPLPVAGLGFRVTALVPFWPDVKQLNERGEQTGLYSASEYRVEVGWLRWHYNFLSRALRPEAAVQPEVELEGLYGAHRFEFAAKQNILALDIPSAAYSYVGGAVALKLHILRRVQARLGLALAGMLTLGQMAEPGAPGDDATLRGYHSYGPGGGWLYRTDMALRVRLVAGLMLGLTGYYEQVKLSFEGQGDVLLLGQPAGGGPKEKVTAVTDEYGGVALSLGYLY